MSNVRKIREMHDAYREQIANESPNEVLAPIIFERRHWVQFEELLEIAARAVLHQYEQIRFVFVQLQVLDCMRMVTKTSAILIFHECSCPIGNMAMLVFVSKFFQRIELVAVVSTQQMHRAERSCTELLCNSKVLGDATAY